MYVCICQAITESEIAAAIGDGARTVDQLRDRLAAASCCGACTDVVMDCLNRFAPAAPASPRPNALSAVS